MLIGRNIIGTVSYLGGVPTIPTPFVKAWGEMIQFNSEYFTTQEERIFYNPMTASYHSFARNSAVEQMKGDWLLQLDTDIVFEPDIVLRMLNKMNKFGIDVLVAPYLYKISFHPPVLYGYDPDKKEKTLIGKWDRNADLIPIKGAGGGCLLVRKNVYTTIQKKLKCSPFDIYFDKQTKSPLSEDHSFFERCWNLKIPCYAAPDITVNHLMWKQLEVYKDFDERDGRFAPKKIRKFWV